MELVFKKQFEDEGVEVGDIDVIFSVKDHLAHLEIVVEKDGKILFCNKYLDTTKDRFKQIIKSNRSKSLFKCLLIIVKSSFRKGTKMKNKTKTTPLVM